MIFIIDKTYTKHGINIIKCANMLNIKKLMLHSALRFRLASASCTQRASAECCLARNGWTQPWTDASSPLTINLTLIQHVSTQPFISYRVQERTLLSSCSDCNWPTLANFPPRCDVTDVKLFLSTTLKVKAAIYN